MKFIVRDIIMIKSHCYAIIFGALVVYIAVRYKDWKIKKLNDK